MPPHALLPLPVTASLLPRAAASHHSVTQRWPQRLATVATTASVGPSPLDLMDHVPTERAVRASCGIGLPFSEEQKVTVLETAKFYLWSKSNSSTSTGIFLQVLLSLAVFSLNRDKGSLRSWCFIMTLFNFHSFQRITLEDRIISDFGQENCFLLS